MGRGSQKTASRAAGLSGDAGCGGSGRFRRRLFGGLAACQYQHPPRAGTQAGRGSVARCVSCVVRRVLWGRRQERETPKRQRYTDERSTTRDKRESCHGRLAARPSSGRGGERRRRRFCLQFLLAAEALTDRGRAPRLPIRPRARLPRRLGLTMGSARRRRDTSYKKGRGEKRGENDMESCKGLRGMRQKPEIPALHQLLLQTVEGSGRSPRLQAWVARSSFRLGYAESHSSGTTSQPNNACAVLAPLGDPAPVFSLAHQQDAAPSADSFVRPWGSGPPPQPFLPRLRILSQGWRRNAVARIFAVGAQVLRGVEPLLTSHPPLLLAPAATLCLGLDEAEGTRRRCIMAATRWHLRPDMPFQKCAG